MASMVVGGLFNAVAFAGAGFLFSKFGKEDYQKEAKRHNLAIEKFQQKQEAYLEAERKRKNKEQKLKEELREAKGDLVETNNALRSLNEFLAHEEDLPPEFEDFYQPSDEMKKYQIIAVGIMGCGAGWLLHKIF